MVGMVNMMKQKMTETERGALLFFVSVGSKERPMIESNVHSAG